MRKFSLFRGLTSNLPSTKLCKYHSEKSYINQIYYKYAKIHIFPGLHYGIKKNDQRRYKYTVLRRDKYNFGEKKTLVRTKKFYEINIITITQFLFTKNIFVIFDRYVFFFLQQNRQPTVPLFSLTWSCIRMKWTSRRSVSRKTIRRQLVVLISLSAR